MTEGRKIAAILVADVVGFSRLTEADEERTLARLRGLRNELFNPTIEAHGGRVVKRLGDGVIVEFRSVVEAVRCTQDVTRGLAERNAALPEDQRIEVRTGIHLGDVMEEADGDLLGDGVNVAARLQSICQPGRVFLSEDAWRQVRDRLPVTFVDLGDQQLKNIARPVRAYMLEETDGAHPAPHAATFPSHIVAPGERRPVRSLIEAIAELLESVARLVEAYADRAARAGATPTTRFGAIERTRTGIPSDENSTDDPAKAKRFAQRAHDRRLRRAIILAAIVALFAVRECGPPLTRGPPPPPPIPTAPMSR